MSRLPLILVLLIVAVVAVIGITLALQPAQTNPAFDVAVRFVNAAGSGDEETAAGLMGAGLASAVAAECPGGQVTACVAALIPPEWGAFRQFVYRRAEPDGSAGATAWDVDLIGYYAEGVGASGVCVYARLAPQPDVELDASDAGDIADLWRVTAYAGWIHCGDPASRDMADNPAAPNRLP